MGRLGLLVHDGNGLEALAAFEGTRRHATLMAVRAILIGPLATARQYAFGVSQ